MVTHRDQFSDHYPSSLTSMIFPRALRSTSMTTSCRSITCLHSKVNHDLNSIHNWLLAKQPSPNVLKTEYLYCASDFNRYCIKIGGEPLSRVQSTKSLGVMIDQCLGWDEHVNSLCKRVSSGLTTFKKSSSVRSPKHPHNNIQITYWTPF